MELTKPKLHKESPKKKNWAIPQLHEAESSGITQLLGIQKLKATKIKLRNGEELRG